MTKLWIEGIRMPWNVLIRDAEGEPTRTEPFFAYADEPLGGQELAGLTVPLLPQLDNQLPFLLQQEFSVIVPQRDPFSRWLPAAVESLHADLQSIDGDPFRGEIGFNSNDSILSWEASDGDDFSVAAEDHSTIAIALVPGMDYVLRYETPIEDVRVSYEAVPDLAWDTTPKYIIYGLSEIGDIEVAAGQVPIGAMISARFRLPRPHPFRRSAVLIGRVVRHVSKSREDDPGPRRDPAFVSGSRIREALASDPSMQALAGQIPSLTEMKKTQRSDRVMIFVHGTASCSFAHLGDLAAFATQLVRFEHDTFLSINHNSDDLCRLIQQCLPAAEIVLIGHSRGGLVARDAAGKLTAQGRKVDLATFGSPHDGSELVALGKSALSGGYAKRAIVRGAVGVKTYHDRKAGSSDAEMQMELFSGRPLPVGWRDMEIGGSIIGVIRGRPAPQTFASIGAAIDESSMQWWERSLASVVERPNDGIVSYRSARAQGNPSLGDLICGHGKYFKKNEVILLLSQLR